MRTRTPLPTAPSIPLPDAFQAELDSFLLSCEAENLAPKTLRTYEEAVALLGRFLVDRGMPTEPARASDASMSRRSSPTRSRAGGPTPPATAISPSSASSTGWPRRSLTDTSPMARMRPPRVPEEPVPLLREDAVRALLRACEGRLFNDRRDAALVRLLLDSGARRSEIAGLRSTRSTCARRRRPCWARVADLGSSPLDREPPRRSIATCGSAEPIAMLRGRNSGSATTVRSGATASATSSNDAPKRRACRASAPTPSGISSPNAAVGRHAGDRPHAPGRLAEPPDGGSLCGFGRHRPRDRRLPEDRAERQVLGGPSHQVEDALVWTSRGLSGEAIRRCIGRPTRQLRFERGEK